jgi:hypothetical protein
MLRIYQRNISCLGSATALCQDLVEGFSAYTTASHRIGNVPCKSISVPPEILSSLYRAVTQILASGRMHRFAHSH